MYFPVGWPKHFVFGAEEGAHDIFFNHDLEIPLFVLLSPANMYLISGSKVIDFAHPKEPSPAGKKAHNKQIWI